MSYSYDNTYSVYREECVTARKDHTCCACGESIPTKVHYWRVNVIFEGDVRTYNDARGWQQDPLVWVVGFDVVKEHT